MPIDRKKYPDNWDEIAFFVKSRARWICQHCGKQCRKPGEQFDTHKRTATTAHLKHKEFNCTLKNLACLCAPCHIRFDKSNDIVKQGMLLKIKKGVYFEIQ